jgi:hypothetical protein
VVPGATPPSLTLLTQVFILVLIFVSCLAFVVETMPEM